MLANALTIADLAARLRWLRRRQAHRRGEAPLTYRELAARTGWSHGIIGAYLTGKVLPPTDRGRALGPPRRVPLPRRPSCT